MRKIKQLTFGSIVLVAIVLAAPGLFGQEDDDDGGNQSIDLIDDCDPDDPNWAPVGCRQRNGDVTAAEFNLFLRSPLYDNSPPPGEEPGLFLVGHPSWRNEPSHIVIRAGKQIRIKNVGGRPHTFTPVAQFGGGVVPPLNVGTQPAPECADLVELEPGDRQRLRASGKGIQRFQCCFHPWMRATVRVIPDDDDDN
jgi:plastocyanin